MEKKRKQREMIKGEIRKAGGMSGRGRGRGSYGNYSSNFGVGDYGGDYNQQHRKDTLELARMRQRVSQLVGWRHVMTLRV